MIKQEYFCDICGETIKYWRHDDHHINIKYLDHFNRIIKNEDPIIECDICSRCKNLVCDYISGLRKFLEEKNRGKCDEG